MKQIKCVLGQLSHISEILFALAHHRLEPILAIFATQAQKKFYEFLMTNIGYSNIACQTFEEFTTLKQVSGKVVLIMDVPANFQLMTQLLNVAQPSQQTILLLMKGNKKYVNMLKKKVGGGELEVQQIHYADGKLVGINQKIKELVDSSYDMNRAAFYAYGAYLNNFRNNMLKLIFKTQAIDVNQLALSYGFAVAPRVKEGKFLKTKVRSQQVKQKLKEKKAKKVMQQENETQPKPKKGLQKIKQMAAKKTKMILKKRKA